MDSSTESTSHRGAFLLMHYLRPNGTHPYKAHIEATNLLLDDRATRGDLCRVRGYGIPQF